MGSGTFHTSGSVSAESAGISELLVRVALCWISGSVVFHSVGHVEQRLEVKNIFICGIG